MANINNEPDQPVVRKTWTMIKRAIPDYAQGLKIHFCGEDSLVDNAWVSRIDANDKLTIASSKYRPSYNELHKYYRSTSESISTYKYGYGFKSNFNLTTSKNMSIEIVTRDIKRVQSCSNSDNTAFIFAGGTNNQDYNPPAGSIVLKRIPSGNSFANKNTICFGISGDTNAYYKPVNDFQDNSLDTFTLVPGQGIYHNGVKVSECGLIEATTPYGVMQAYNIKSTSLFSSNYCKIHALRIYNRALSDAEIAKNYQKDVLMYDFMSVQGAKIEFTDDIFPVFGRNTCLNDYGIWTASNVGTTAANNAYQSFDSSDKTYGTLSSFSTAGNTTCESIIQLPDRASICPSSIKVCADGIRLIDFKGFNPNTQQWEVIQSIESDYKVNQIFEVTTTKYYTKFSILVYTAVTSSKIQSAIRNFDIHSGILQIQAKTN